MNEQQKQVNKFWRFNPANAATNESAELILYGEISSYESWWRDTITPQQFSDELTALGDIEDLTVRINSGGGDVFAATAIFTRLKSHKATITVIIDGWACSAATIIAMAGDVIKIPAAACFMIHDPALTIWGHYEEDDFVRFQNELITAKNCIINAYTLKTGKDKADISALMKAETWYTGEEAVEAGFCDEVLFAEGAKNKAFAMVADMSRYKNAPKNLFNRLTPPAPPAAESGVLNNTTNQNKEGVKSTMSNPTINTVEELTAAYPQLAAQIAETATTAERQRIQAIENISLAGFETLVNRAKFETPVSAENLATQILAEQKKQGGSYLQNAAADVNNSGMGDVTPGSHEGGQEGKENPYDAAIESMFPKTGQKGEN